MQQIVLNWKDSANTDKYHSGFNPVN